MARRLRLGMVGGGRGAFIGGVHRMASRLDDEYELVAGVLSADPVRTREEAPALHIAPDRAYGDFAVMATSEQSRVDGIDAVAIVTPNHLHHAPARAFLDAGIHVICDKPLCHTMDDARDLERAVAADTALFMLTHNYTGYPLVRQARDIVAAGALGEVRLIQVEYAQEWLSEQLETTGHKQASWRSDPARAGQGGSIGDIGTHAVSLAEFVSGLRVESVSADLQHFVPGRRLDDNAHILLRFGGGARGTLWCSQVAPGNENALRLRVYGATGGLEWAQEQPNQMIATSLGQSTRVIRRGGPGTNHRGRLPPGHPEGYLEAFAQLYRDFAEQIRARMDGRAPAPTSLLVPGIASGMQGMRFIAAAVASSAADAAWVKLEG